MKSLNNGNLTANQVTARQELLPGQETIGEAWVIKEELLWIQKVPTPRAALWRIMNYLKVMREDVTGQALSKPMVQTTLDLHAEQVVTRWISGLSNAGLEVMNSLFQAARSRACG